MLALCLKASHLGTHHEVPGTPHRSSSATTEGAPSKLTRPKPQHRATAWQALRCKRVKVLRALPRNWDPPVQRRWSSHCSHSCGSPLHAARTTSSNQEIVTWERRPKPAGFDSVGWGSHIKWIYAWTHWTAIFRLRRQASDVFSMRRSLCTWRPVCPTCIPMKCHEES